MRFFFIYNMIIVFVVKDYTKEKIFEVLKNIINDIIEK